MDEWTEQEEQQIIERAKTGDPEANYALSLWALRRGEEEPDEPRWNRLAARCLVKSAQAGYGPAKEQMASLLRQSGQSAPASKSAQTAKNAPAAKSTTMAKNAPTAKIVSVPETEPPKPALDDEDDSAPVRRSTPARRGDTLARLTAAVKRSIPRLPRSQDDDEEFGDDQDDEPYDDQDDEPPVRRTRRNAGHSRDDGGDSRQKWGDDKWRRLELACVFVCAALLVIIAVLIISGRHNDGDGKENGSSAIPPAGEVGAVSANGTDGTTTSGGYPDDATKSAIMAAGLDIQPSPEDYVTEPTTGTVSVSSEYLRLRKGPNTTYDPIAQMPNGTTVSVFAMKNDWDLILYQGDEGPTYGWCSSEYVILTAGDAAPTATDAPGTVEG